MMPITANAAKTSLQEVFTGSLAMAVVPPFMYHLKGNGAYGESVNPCGAILCGAIGCLMLFSFRGSKSCAADVSDLLTLA